MADLDCTHPADSVTWSFKGPGKTVAIINGRIYGTCDDCGVRVMVTPDPGWIPSTETTERNTDG